MILQTDTRLNENINEWGCFLMCIIYIAHKILKENFRTCTPELIENIYKECLEKRYMKSDCYILIADSVLATAIEHVCNHNGSAMRSFDSLSYDGWGSPDYKSIPNVAYTIGAWVWKFKHFVVMNGNGMNRSDVEYDPLGESWSVKNGKLESTRVFVYV